MGRIFFEIFNYMFMVIVTFLCIAPVLHVIFASVSEPEKLAAYEGILLKPLGFTLEGYKLVFRNPSIVSGFINTLIYVVTNTTLGMLLTVIGGYVLSRKRFIVRDFVMLYITFTMFFNGGLIPFYMVVKSLGMIDTRWALIIPSCLSAFNLIIMRTSFMEIPDSLEESARIDGASDVTILFRIFVPLARPTIAVLILFSVVANWNSWFNALIFLRNRSLYPLQLILREIVMESSATTMLTQSMVEGKADLYKLLVKYSTIVVATIPILFVYPFVQKHFVKGIMIGAIKG